MGGGGFGSGSGRYYRGGRERISKPKGGTPGNNQTQNRQFDDAVKAAEKIAGKKLSPDQKTQLHNDISKQGYGFHEIVEEALEMLK